MSVNDSSSVGAPYVVVLGTAQDGGSPQVNAPASHPGRRDGGDPRLVSCIGLVDPGSGARWIFDATPDFRVQARTLSELDRAGAEDFRLDGVFLTHAHMGHYTGLLFLGHESMGARSMPVHVTPRFADFLRANEPWRQLIDFGNIDLVEMTPEAAVKLSSDLVATPIRVPHREEFSEVVAFRIAWDGAVNQDDAAGGSGAAGHGAVLFVPDIDAWTPWDEQGHRLEDELARVGAAFIDGTFFSGDELPGRDMSAIPHPRIEDTMTRLAALPAAERAKVRFIHLNHTNPAQWPGSEARRSIEEAGFGVAVRGDRYVL